MIQDFLVRYYDWRPTSSVLLNKVTGNASKVLSQVANLILPLWFRLFPAVETYRRRLQQGEGAPVVVCLTSFPQRIASVWLVVECLLRQSLPPERIVLYLAQSQFPMPESLPLRLREYQQKGVLTIEFVEPDIRSHKKYWFALQQFPGKPLITVDDDIIYDSHLVAGLVRCAARYPQTIPACFCHPMRREQGRLLPYSSWGIRKVKPFQPHKDYFFGSGGGTLFPPGSLDGACVPVETLRAVCPTADDIFLNAVVRSNGYSVCSIKDKLGVPEWRIPGNVSLQAQNNGQGQNDVQLQQVVRYFQETRHQNPFE